MSSKSQSVFIHMMDCIDKKKKKNACFFHAEQIVIDKHTYNKGRMGFQLY